ncbi:MAG: substrate-binding domain-containing protein [Dehalococcoidia bacterium]|nr:substrate-binding domain-containing protein [Dehalococcoidia bacterium]
MRALLSCLVILSILVPFTISCGQVKTPDFSVHVYTRSDACGAAETWAKYLGNYMQEDLKGTAVFGDPGLSEAVIKDSLAIGFNNIGYAYDTKTGEQLAGLCVIPIDINENGQIDNDEDFYGRKSTIVQAIAQGRYPSPPARDLHLVTKGKFNGITKEFVRWILIDGQKYVDEMGYIKLPTDKIDQQLNKLGQTESGIKMEGVITISGAFALYPMMVRWDEEFRKIYPNIKLDISAGGAGKGMTDALNGMVDIGMISRDINAAEIEKGAFWISVTKDAVVPVTNRSNPFLSNILTKGIKRQTFVDIWITGNISDWPSAIR